MPFYTKFTIVCLLFFMLQISNAQTDTLSHVQADSLPLKPKFPKFEIGLIAPSLYYVPDYFDDQDSFLPLVGLQVKYYGNSKNAVRAAYAYSNLKKAGNTSVIMQQVNRQQTKQVSLGFQHIFFTQKNLNAYWFADFYYQNYWAKGSSNKTSYQTPAKLVFIDYDSTVSFTQNVNSFNLVGGFGIKFLDRKHIFLSVEGGLGISYYSGTQQANSHSTTTCTTEQVNPPSTTQISTLWSYYHQLPRIDTKIRGTNLNASVLRIVLGVVF